MFINDMKSSIYFLLPIVAWNMPLHSLYLLYFLVNNLKSDTIEIPPKSDWSDPLSLYA